MTPITNSIAPPAVVKVAQHALGAGNGHAVGIIAEHPLDGQCFDFIVQHGARAVSINIADLFRLIVGIFQCQIHATGGAAPFGMHVGNAEGILRGAVTCQLGQNFRAAALGMFQRFENDHGRPFADHKAISIAIERPHGMGGIVISLR